MKQTSFTILLLWLIAIGCFAQQKSLVDGRYILSYNLPSGETPVVGYLLLNSGIYNFEFDKNYKQNDTAKYPPFCFVYPSGKFTSSYTAGIYEATDWNKLANHEAIFHIRLYANEKEIYRSLIRLNKEKKTLYFHSSGSREIWNIERSNTANEKITSVDVFIKACQRECSTSSLRYKTNINGSSEPTDQCELIKYYAEMIFGGSENVKGAKLILKDVCPQALDLMK